jgi:hypothetical protein
MEMVSLSRGGTWPLRSRDALGGCLHHPCVAGVPNFNAAVRDVLRMLDGASLIYRSTSFTVDGTTAGGIAQFAAKRVIVYTDTNNPYSGSATCSTSSQSGSCGASEECAQGYLDMVTLASPNTTVPDAGWDDFCLVHAFTHRDFCGGILGLAWVGTAGSLSAGICAKRAGSRGSLNTGISTTINFGQDVSTQVQIITLAHEFGHNFGSNHDTTGLVASNGATCSPAGSLGNFIMCVLHRVPIFLNCPPITSHIFTWLPSYRNQVPWVPAIFSAVIPSTVHPLCWSPVPLARLSLLTCTHVFVTGRHPRLGT